MASHNSTQHCYQDWLTTDAYYADSKRSSLAPSLNSKKPGLLSDFYKVSPIISSENLKHVQDNFTVGLMSATESTSHWPALHSFAQYSPQAYHSSPSPPDQYCASPDAVDLDYGLSPPDGASYVYDLPQHFAPIDAASSCPRIYSDEVDSTFFTAPELEAEAYPPTSYLMDPLKHELYIDPTSQHVSHQCRSVECPQETLSLSPIDHDGSPDSPAALPLDQTSSSKPCKKREGSKKNTTHLRKDEEPPERPNQPQKMKEETDSEEHEPYAKLIYKALMSAPGCQMVLKEIYQWFMKYTDKGKSPSQKGWQNSIRHNLSMNGVSKLVRITSTNAEPTQAFKKVEQGPSADASKRGFVWVLEPSAIIEGVKSTTRYRKPPPSKKVTKSGKPALQRQVSGRKGGQAARRAKCAKSKRSEKGMNPAVAALVAAVASISVGADDSPSDSNGNEALPTECGDDVFESSTRYAQQPATPVSLSEDCSCYPYYLPLTASLSEPSKMDQNPFMINDIVGVVDDFPGESLFCDSSGMMGDPSAAGLSPQDASPGF